MIRAIVGLLVFYALYRWLIKAKSSPAIDHQYYLDQLHVEQARHAITSGKLLEELVRLRQERIDWLTNRELDQRIANDALKEAAIAKAALRAALTQCGATPQAIDGVIAGIENIHHES